MSNNKKKGLQGEEIAIKYLESLNHKIIQRNFRSPHGEIDIITLHENCLVFVEVKLRMNNAFGDVLEQITNKKKEHIIHTAEHYIQNQSISIKDCRFDVVTIVFAGGSHKIDHIENAFGT